jgi:hypothetical protein
MAKLLLTRSYNRWTTIWVDPDTTKNRIFLDTLAYDFSTLSPKFIEQFYWQARQGVQQQAPAEFDNWGPIQTNNIDANAWADGDNSIWSMPGIFNLWMMSLDPWVTKSVRAFRSARGVNILTYPASGTTSDQYGAWWFGADMTKRALATHTQDTNYYVHLFEHNESINFNATSWSYSGTTITVNRNAHGFSINDTITVTGATTTLTLPPNGTFLITGVTNVNAFTYRVATAPTGTAGGTMNVVGNSQRLYGFEQERDGTAPSILTRFVKYERHNTVNADNVASSTTAGASTPVRTSIAWGTHKFWLGTDDTHIFIVSISTGANNISVDRYTLANGANVATNMLAATNVANATTNIINQYPSNIRHDSATRKVFYTGTFNTTGLITPLRIVWTRSASSTVVSTGCSMVHPAGTTGNTFVNVPTASLYNANGYNVFWCKPHQFTINGVNYITFVTIDQYFYARTTRFASIRQRTWATYRISAGSADDTLTFHSACSFPDVNDFPLNAIPFTEVGDKMVVASTNNTTIYTYDVRTFSASSWSYTVPSSVLNATVTITLANHGLTVGTNITVSGTSASTNPPNGVYKIATVPSANTFTFIVSSATSGVPTGTASGTPLISLGWQATTVSAVRARGMGVDTLGRLWVTARTPTIGRVEIHLITEVLPNSITIRLDNAIPGTDLRYVYSGTAISANALVDVFNAAGSRVISSVLLTISGSSMTFANGATSVSITTSASATTQVPVSIIDAGQSQISATIKI